MKNPLSTKKRRHRRSHLVANQTNDFAKTARTATARIPCRSARRPPTDKLSTLELADERICAHLIYEGDPVWSSRYATWVGGAWSTVGRTQWGEVTVGAVGPVGVVEAPRVESSDRRAMATAMRPNYTGVRRFCNVGVHELWSI
jgi:hypothetical protein